VKTHPVQKQLGKVMNKPMPYTRAVPFSRPAGRRRIAVFSLKVGRRLLCLGGYDAYRTWLFIEANPLIVTFCERLTYVDGPKSAVIDFWVQLRGTPVGEFWTVEGRVRPSSKLATTTSERHDCRRDSGERHLSLQQLT